MQGQEQADDVLDPTALSNLQEMVGGDSEFFAELIDTFLAEAPQLVSDMHRAAQNGDAAGLRLAAHSLKSNSTEFGAVSLSALCREVEAMGKAGALEGAAEKLNGIDREFEKVRAALDQMRLG